MLSGNRSCKYTRNTFHLKHKAVFINFISCATNAPIRQNFFGYLKAIDRNAQFLLRTDIYSRNQIVYSYRFAYRVSHSRAS